MMTDISKKHSPSIDWQDRLIVALDFPSVKDAKEMVNLIGDAVHFYKIGLELFMNRECFNFIEWLNEKNKKIFLDLKFFDIPNTVKRAFSQLSQYPVTFATIHGNDEIIKAALEIPSNVGILAVTLLTAFDHNDIQRNLGMCDDQPSPHFTIPQIQDIVRYRAVKAKNLGCAGVIIAGTEVKKLRKECPSPFVFVTPGIRETSLPTNAHDDQKRTMTAKQALEAGSDYLVVGRPICMASSPRDIALEIMEDVRYFGSHTAS